MYTFLFSFQIYVLPSEWPLSYRFPYQVMYAFLFSAIHVMHSSPPTPHSLIGKPRIKEKRVWNTKINKREIKRGKFYSMADAVKRCSLLKISCLDVLWPIFCSIKKVNIKQNGSVHFQGKKAVRTETHRSISRNTMPWGPLEQFNKFQLAYICRTVSTRASNCFPVSFHTQNKTHNTFDIATQS
jgi:hypothetical protein